MIVPVGGTNKLTERALQAALSLGDEVIAVSLHPHAGQGAAFRARWDDWNPGVRLDTLDSPHRSQYPCPAGSSRLGKGSSPELITLYRAVLHGSDQGW